MSFCTAGANAAAAAVMGSGPYTARFGTGISAAGVTGEPTDGVSGYGRPTVTVTVTDNQIAVTSAITLGAITADLGAVRAVSLHDTSGNARVCGWLSETVMLSNGSTQTLPANAITFTLPLAGV